MNNSTSPHQNKEFLEAEQLAQEKFNNFYIENFNTIPEQGSLEYSNYGKLKNTFEHVFTSAYFTYKYSAEDTKILGLIKEIFTLDKEIEAHSLNGTNWERGKLIAFQDGNRDMWNNEIGIQYALNGLQNSQNLDIVAKNIFNNLINGNDFIVDFESDNRRWNNIQNINDYRKTLNIELIKDLTIHPQSLLALALIKNKNLQEKVFDLYNRTTLGIDIFIKNITNCIDNRILDIQNLFTQAQSTSPIVIDPILIDLNGDGVKTTTVENGIYFDHENDGFMETSAWVDENDGVLAIDKNNNGYIDNGNEIFGDNYIKQNGAKATSGFDALKDLDSNNDGIINSNDEQFNNIKILKGDNTLLTLEQAGIQSINLSKSNTNKTDESGNIIISSGTFTKTNGTTGFIADYSLNANMWDSKELEKVEVSPDVEQLPDIKETGKVHSLHQAIMLDSTGELKQLVQSFVDCQNEVQRRELVSQILLKWTNADTSNRNAGAY